MPEKILSTSTLQYLTKDQLIKRLTTAQQSNNALEERLNQQAENYTKLLKDYRPAIFCKDCE